MFLNPKTKNGFTFIEIIVTVAILAILCSATYGFFTSMYKGIAYYRERAAISALAEQYLEIARNLPYAQVGTQNGNPNGPLPDSPSPINITFNGINYRIYYIVNALHDLADTNVGVQDYKQVKLYIKNIFAETTNSFVTTIAPISLASMGSGGVLSLQVINKTWQPVPGAAINIINTNITPNINLTRTCDANGRWVEIGLPPDSNYHITATKNGYSTDKTYSIIQYPGASNPDATVIDGQVTQNTFVIDRLSNLVFNTQNQTCQPIQAVGVNVQGAKLISPGVSKFNENYTSNSSGVIYPASTSSCSSSCGAGSCCLEWDNYTPALTGSSYMIYGTSPIQSVDLSPNSSQNFNLILGPKTANSLLAVVKDVFGNPIEGAKVELSNAGLSYNNTKYTGGSVWSQYDWSGGSGQADWSWPDRYYQDDGNISNNVIPLALRLSPGSSPYNMFGSLISSAFDTGTNQTSYTTLNWQATTEDQVTNIKFQIATNNDNTTWNFAGPDGTANSYYEVPGTTINSANNNMRYIRYKAYLATNDSQKTPMLSNVSVNYVSGCPTPGQAMFSGLTAYANYTLVFSDTSHGYQTQTFNNVNISEYFILQIILLQ
ncbi:MAG: prepilin-type N-terminal cleavage/methylation domain-containing protein [Patescibacteria group bacterium]